MKIHVSLKHIKAGKRATYTQCPVALALRDAFGCRPYVTGVDKNHMDGSYIKVGSHKFEMPGAVKKFVPAFDDGKKVKPFTFELTFG